MSNSLIYGKNNTERIVALEVVDPNVELYIQNEDGSIRTEYQPNKYWMLTDKPVKDFVRLKGDLHYKYGRQFIEREDFTKMRSVYTKRNDLYSIWNPQEACMVKDGYTLFKGMKTSDISVLAFDIESPGMSLDIYSKVLIIANTFRDSKGSVTRKLFTYDKYASQGAMLVAWTEWVKAMNPTVICGHNINTFDIPYIQHVADMEQVELRLGRDNSPLTTERRDSKFRRDGSQYIEYKKHKIFGRHIVDTFFLSIKYDVGRKYENYKLKYIIDHEGLEVENRQFYDGALIKKNYTIPEEWEKIKAYATFDGDDALKLYDLMIPAFFYFTQSVPKTIQNITESSTGAPLNSLLIRSYLQNGHSIPKASELVNSVEGGLSFAVPGIYNNLKKWDLRSAYPSQILRFKLFDKNKDPEGNFYEMVKHFTYERFELKDKYKETKDKYYLDREQSSKITINSAYGLCNTNGLNFNSQEIAAKITKETREVLNQAIVWASGKDKDYWIQIFKEKTGQINAKKE